VQPAGLLPGHLRRRAEGMDSRPMEAFIDVDISKAGNRPLV
jgi:hypothetical protein